MAPRSQWLHHASPSWILRTSVNEEKTRSALAKSRHCVTRLGTAQTCSPASFAEIKPLWESSIARQCAVSNENRFAASIHKSGAGLIRGASPRQTTSSKYEKIPNLFNQPSTQKCDELDTTASGIPRSRSKSNTSLTPGMTPSSASSAIISCCRDASRASQSKLFPVNSSKWVFGDHVAKSLPMQRV